MSQHYTKETLEGTCIKCTSKVNGKNIIKFYKYYGFSDRLFAAGRHPTNGLCYGPSKIGSLKGVIACTSGKIIKVPTSMPKIKLTFPREMMVSDLCGAADSYWHKALIIGWCGTLAYPFLTQSRERIDRYTGFKYAKEIE